jgi:hypothetical protein
MPDKDNKIMQDDSSAEEALDTDDPTEKVKSDVPPPGEDDPAEEAEGVEEGEEKVPDIVPDLMPTPEEEPEPTEAEDSTDFDDPKTDEAIDEIVAKEGDEVLAAQDAAAAKGQVKPKHKAHGTWGRKLLRWLVVLVIVGGLVAVAVIPKMRYLVLNTAGVRSSLSLSVEDSTTQLPLKDVHVTLAGQNGDTDRDGQIRFAHLKLGPAKLVISQPGFAEIKRTITVGWGSNPLGTFELKATGVQYVIEVKDYLSDKPLEGAEASVEGVANALSNKEGNITLTLPNTVLPNGGVKITKAGYRVDTVTLSSDLHAPTKVALVLDRKAVFMVKEGGKYNLYKSDLDGKNRTLLLGGTGAETSNISLALSPDGTRAALVSTRDNKVDASGFLQSSLALINVANGTKLTIAESSQIQLVDWVGSRLIFQYVSTTGSRYVVTSYNCNDNTRLQLAAANNVTTAVSAKGLLYYAVGADPSNPLLQLGLFKISPDGNNKQRLIEDELSTVLRSTYNSLSLQTTDGTWYLYDLSTGSKTQTGTPASLANRQYVDNAERTLSLWVNQGALMSHDIATDKDTSIKAQSGLTYPIMWVGTAAAIYRVSSGSETADYAVSLLGGSAHKIADVATTYGFAQAQ